MIFDTDVMIHIERGHAAARKLFEAETERAVSAQTWMEWLQGARDRKHLDFIRDFAGQMGLRILPLTDRVSERAIFLVEEHALGDGLKPGDALIAATALEHALTLATGNVKHFKHVRNLKLVGLKA